MIHTVFHQTFHLSTTSWLFIYNICIECEHWGGKLNVILNRLNFS